MSGGDGMSFSTLVPIVRRAWAHVVTSFVLGIICRRFLRIRLQWRLPVLVNPQVWLPGGRMCAKPGLEDKTGWANRW
jgi:hypothetical protein